MIYQAMMKISRLVSLFLKTKKIHLLNTLIKQIKQFWFISIFPNKKTPKIWLNFTLLLNRQA